MLITLAKQGKHKRKEIHFNYNRKIWFSKLAIFICVLMSSFPKTTAVPTSNASSDSASSLQLWHIVGDGGSKSVHGEGKDERSSEEASNHTQGQCLMNGVPVTEGTVFCEPRRGCRAIQKTGYCCPDYKCDCEKDGKVYVNGEKLVDPETPCTVCYCQGGDILCSSVTCFHRDDCTPLYIPGRCCPEYDNCPVLNSEAITTTSESVLTLDTSSTKPETHSSSINQKITIKEITKPTEIRITNENKNKATHHMVIKTVTPETTTLATTTNTIRPTISTITTDSSFVGHLTQQTSSNQDVIPIFGIQKLQLVQNDSTNFNERNLNNEHLSGAHEVADSVLGPLESSNPPDLIYRNLQKNNSMRHTFLDLDPDTSGSDNIYHIISTTDGPRFTTSDDALEFQGHSSKSNATEKCLHGKKPKAQHLQNSTVLHKNTEIVVNGTNKSTSPEHSMIKKSDQDKPIMNKECPETNYGIHYSEDEEMPLSMDANPAYPSLPEDDFSLRDINFPLGETDDIGEVDIKDQSRSISGHFDVSKGIKHLNEANNSDAIIANTTVAPTSSTIHLEDSEIESLETKDIGCSSKKSVGNSTEKISKEREPTTPVPTKGMDDILDIDGPGNASDDGHSATADDPKLDVESLKIDENQEESLAGPDTFNKDHPDSKI